MWRTCALVRWRLKKTVTSKWGDEAQACEWKPEFFSESKAVLGWSALVTFCLTF